MTIGTGWVSNKFSKGDLVISNFFPFSEYSIVKAKFLRVVEILAYLSTLGKTWEGKTLALFSFLILKTVFKKQFCKNFLFFKSFLIKNKEKIWKTNFSCSLKITFLRRRRTKKHGEHHFFNQTCFICFFFILRTSLWIKCLKVITYQWQVLKTVSN